MSTLMLVRIALVGGGVAAALLHRLGWLDGTPLRRPARVALSFVALANLGLLAFIWLNHIRFPLGLEIMEPVVLEHVLRAISGQPIYPAPSPEFVALAYNPLYYYISIPFVWVWGADLSTLRGVSIAASIGIMAVLYSVTTRKTQSRWWGVMAIGLFAAHYRIMDSYVDTAHSDASQLLCILLGCLVIDRSASRAGRVAGVLLLVASFWLKQHGALFALGGLAFITWRHGLRDALPGWIAAILLGPVLYVFAGPTLFGSHFHYFTWQVPSGWSSLDPEHAVRLGQFIVFAYPILALSSMYLCVASLRGRAGAEAGSVPLDSRPGDSSNRSGLDMRQLDVWVALLPVAFASAAMGSLDEGSSNNVYIALGLWFLILGVPGVALAAERITWIGTWRLHYVALFAVFALVLFRPQALLAHHGAQAAYEDLVAEIEGLDGPVYMPSVGQLPHGATLHPAAHWVALDDIVRGRNGTGSADPVLREILAPLLDPPGTAYILTNLPLRLSVGPIDFLDAYYTEKRDYRSRFNALRSIPHRWDLDWPRYLYRFDSSK